MKQKYIKITIEEYKNLLMICGQYNLLLSALPVEEPEKPKQKQKMGFHTEYTDKKEQ